LKDTTVFTLSSIALSNQEAWDGAIFAFSDNEEQRKFTQKYQHIFGTRPAVLDMIAYDLMKTVKNSINSGRPITNNNYEGCLGEFSINAKSGLVRKLQIFRLEKSEKINLTEAMNSNREDFAAESN
jgi:hypothetical protein